MKTPISLSKNSARRRRNREEEEVEPHSADTSIFAIGDDDDTLRVVVVADDTPGVAIDEAKEASLHIRDVAAEASLSLDEECLPRVVALSSGFGPGDLHALAKFALDEGRVVQAFDRKARPTGETVEELLDLFWPPAPAGLPLSGPGPRRQIVHYNDYPANVSADTLTLYLKKSQPGEDCS